MVECRLTWFSADCSVRWKVIVAFTPTVAGLHSLHGVL